MRRTTFPLFAALLLAACTSSVGDPAEPASAQQALTLEVTDAIQIAGILGYELSGLLDEVPGLGGEGESPMPGPSGSEPIGSDDCASVDWDAAALLGITVTFDECVLDDGDRVNGTVAVRLGAVTSGQVTVDFEDLSIGDRLLTGTMTLTATPDDIVVDASLDYLDADTILGIELERIGMGIRGDGLHFNGDATIVRDGQRLRVALNDVTWSLASLCHPTDGSIDVTPAGEPPFSVLFSRDGVTLQVGAEPPVQIPSAC